jgi:hexosaminidase
MVVFSARSDLPRRSGSAAVRPRLRLVALAAVAASSMILPGAVPADASSPGARAGVLATHAASSVRFGGPIPRLQGVAPADRLVPRPASLQDLSGAGFRFGPRTRVVVDGGPVAVRVARDIARRLRRSTGYSLPVLERSQSPRDALVLRIRPAAHLPGTMGSEGYRLVAGPTRVVIDARTASGLFRGTQTLRQLLPPQVESRVEQPGPWAVPAVRIVDHPRFRYRGAMLDVVRHFLTVAEVKRYINHMALYKLNRLHLHLSDDQGWRIEIKGWPRLTRYGSTTEVGNGPGGYYTQAEYSSIVRYARKRFITVIPEIDTPSHTNAALASYPQLNCDGEAPPLYTGIDVGFSSLCIDKEVTYRFLDDVVGQLARLTPGRYLHLGGDEAHSTDHADYVRFVERVERIVRRHGKRMMGWAETSAAHLRRTGLAQYWNPATGTDSGTETATNAAAQGVRLVMSPASKAYLDMKYAALTPMGLSWAGFVEVKDSYNWDPVTYVSGIKESDVAGVEAPVWTETLKDLRDVEYMAFPRLAGIAEKGWSPAGQTWEEYRTRLATQSPRWEVMGVNYYCSPQVDWTYCRTTPVPPSTE